MASTHFFYRNYSTTVALGSHIEYYTELTGLPAAGSKEQTSDWGSHRVRSTDSEDVVTAQIVVKGLYLTRR